MEINTALMVAAIVLWDAVRTVVTAVIAAWMVRRHDRKET